MFANELYGWAALIIASGGAALLTLVGCSALALALATKKKH